MTRVKKCYQSQNTALTYSKLHTFYSLNFSLINLIMIVYYFVLYSFPGATNETLLVKFNSSRNHHRLYYDTPQMRESAFIVEHYAGSVKYSIEVNN